ncbi:phosphoribosyltransferase [Pontibacter sp. BT310]|uniref:Phosphoribosyltransferase n=1 Tax=Pontibacter populi TaxID=890055 RepID=A0ABS6XEB0_9BACT|nr:MULTISPECIES: phosphoribosyltransferase family protein [Pontibacter]MBJ6119459.1 phosphoribosyltransferase [Pontibacter sp. BT310]MBR0571887.1 phosphoribosyltransferase [Microvirga sp. STS03]MBW3366313.1 phosphoribosyltransferase [Pontibacter populi]
MEMIRNREEAAEMLADLLEQYRGQDGVVLAIPRGGVPVAAPIARRLHMPLEVMLIKKIGHPANPEYAIGSVSLDAITIDPTIEVPREYIDAEAERVRESLRKKYTLFMGDRKPIPLKDKLVIIVDDGIATGKTLMATIEQAKKQEPAKIIVAVPVAPQAAIERFSEEADEVICLLTPPFFQAVGQFYVEFRQTSDEEVIALLQHQ